MAQSKSNMDPHYLQEHRKQLSDQVFEELLKRRDHDKQHGAQSLLPDLPHQ